MKSMGVALWSVGGCLLMVSAYAACPPEAWMCASPMMNQANPNDLSQSLQKESPILFENRHFALQRDDTDPGHSLLRPVIKIGDDVRVSVKVGPHHGEVKVKWRW